MVTRYLNIRLDTIKVQNADQHPHMVSFGFADQKRKLDGHIIDGC